MFLRFQSIQLAVKTDAIVTADYASALRTFPSIFLLYDKLLDTVLLDELKVFDHAHPEESSIAIIDVTEPFTWEILTVITVSHLTIQEQIASLLEECTLLIPRSATDAVRHFNPLAFHIMFESKVSTTYCTIHPAGSDQLRVYTDSCFQYTIFFTLSR